MDGAVRAPWVTAESREQHEECYRDPTTDRQSRIDSKPVSANQESAVGTARHYLDDLFVKRVHSNLLLHHAHAHQDGVRLFANAREAVQSATIVGWQTSKEYACEAA